MPITFVTRSSWRVPQTRGTPLAQPGVVESPIPVAVVLSSFDRGGTERQMTELVCRLDPARFAVHVICLRREGPWLGPVERSAASVSEFRLGSFASRSAFGAIRAMARWMRDTRVAVVQTCDLYANIAALPAARLAGVPVRLASRRGIVSPVATRGLMTLQRYSYTLAHRVVANSNAAGAQLRAEGVPAARVAVIPNGIDLGAFAAAPDRRTVPLVVTTIANLRVGKAHDVLLRAAARVLSSDVDVRFRLVGDGPLRSSLEAMAARLGIADRIEFLGHRDDVPRLLAESHVFAFPSLMEAFPNGVMEAMAAGLPVVATRVGGIPELIEDGRNGLLVPAGDADALAGGISRLLGDAAFASACGAAARQTIATRYSFDRMVAAFEALYLDELALRDGPVGSRLPIRSSAHL